MAKDAIVEENLKLRALLALVFTGPDRQLLYTDDGCVQDNRSLPCIDFHRDNVEVLAFKISQRAEWKARNETSNR